MSEVNHELFVKVLAHIVAHPESWRQGTWGQKTECGTVACFAGWACVLSPEVKRINWSYARADGQTIPRKAEEILGIDDASIIDDDIDEKYLFDGDNNMDDLYEISAYFMGIDEQVLRDKVADRVASGTTIK